MRRRRVGMTTVWPWSMSLLNVALIFAIVILHAATSGYPPTLNRCFLL